MAAPRGWTAWSASWLATLAASLLAVLVLGHLSSRSAEEALATALADHVVAQAGVAASVVGDLPLEALASMGGGRASARLEETLEGLAAAGELHDLAVFDPAGAQLAGARGVELVAARAERDLIGRAGEGDRLAGTLYRDQEGVLYLTGYAPVAAHPGWVVAVEGSGAVLGSVDRLERLNMAVGAVVVILAGLLGAVLARWVVGPIRRLDRDLRGASPGDPPGAIRAAGPREVQGAALAARGLLAAIRERDAEIAEAHEREVEQVRRIAAEIAHEVRNPLNALALSAQILEGARDDERRARLARRVGAQVEQLEAIVRRLVDVTRPLAPEPAEVDLVQLVFEAAEEARAATGLEIHVDDSVGASVRSDRVMLAEVLRNLLLNAGQAGARIVVIVTTRTKLGAELTVEDDGPGIPAGQEERIFEWFVTTRAQGSGLGLPASRRVMEALGGALELACPRPARFLLRIPMELP